MTAPIATAIVFTIAFIGLMVVNRLGKRPLYVAIPAGTDPLTEGRDGFAGLARRARAQRLLRLLYVIGVTAFIVYGWVLLDEPVRVLYEHYNPAPVTSPLPQINGRLDARPLPDLPTTESIP